ISVNDPDARHTRKSPGARRGGYRAHVSADPETGLITGEQLTQAAGAQNSDAAVAAQMLAAGTGEAEVYGDSAYGTGDLRAARARWAAEPGLRENYRKHRPNIERVISQVASRGGRRLKLRYLGTAKNNAWLKNRAATLNLRNLISRGLAFENGARVLACPPGPLTHDPLAATPARLSGSQRRATAPPADPAVPASPP